MKQGTSYPVLEKEQPTASVSSKAYQIAPLDGVRGIAALMVIVFHGWQVGALDGLGLGSLTRVAKFGQTGVDLFFVLSGFLITRILIASTNKPHYFRDFYARRALRILPLYYFFLVVFFLVFPLLRNHPYPPFQQTWWWWVYLQNVPPTFADISSLAGPGHYWSLAVEEHFYFIWPLLVFYAPFRLLPWLSGLIILTALATRWVFVCKFGLNPFYFTLCRMDALAMGTLLACMEASGLLFRFRKQFLVVFLLLLPALAIAWLRLADKGIKELEVLKYTVVGVLYWALLGLVICYQKEKWIKLSLANKPIRFCGGVAYGLYVYQGLMIPLLAVWLPPSRHGILFLALVIVLTLLISWLSFQFIETPFLKLKRFFNYGSHSQVSTRSRPHDA